MLALANHIFSVTTYHKWECCGVRYKNFKQVFQRHKESFLRIYERAQAANY